MIVSFSITLFHNLITTSVPLCVIDTVLESKLFKRSLLGMPIIWHAHIGQSFMFYCYLVLLIFFGFCLLWDLVWIIIFKQVPQCSLGFPET